MFETTIEEYKNIIREHEKNGKKIGKNNLYRKRIRQLEELQKRRCLNKPNSKSSLIFK